MLVVTVDLLTGSFDASSGSTHAQSVHPAEWPPEPARLYAALVSVHERVDGAVEALRWLESQPPPEIRCSDAEQGVLSSYVVVNATDPKPTHAFHLGRGSAGQRRSWPRSHLAVPVVQVVWPDANPPDSVRVALEQMARRIPYFGRATSNAVVRVGGDVDERLDRWVPSRSGLQLLRIPYEGYLNALVAAYERGDEHHDLAHRVGYERVARDAADPDVWQPPFGDLIVRPLAGRRLDGSHVVRLTSSLRNALHALGHSIPEVHGHGDRSGPQVAFLGLPAVGQQRGDGTIGSLALAIPVGMDPAEVLHLKRVFMNIGAESGLQELVCGPLGVLGFDNQLDRGVTASPGWWTRTSYDWVTATPVVLDRFPRKPADLAAEMSDTIERAGYPRPASCRVSIEPLAAGGVKLSPRQAVRSRADRPARPLPYRHVAVRFPVPVRGPVLAGQMRFFGVGLFMPTRFQQERATKGTERAEVATR